MLISSLNTFFVHIPKTGGTSIEMALFEKDGLHIDPGLDITNQLTSDQRRQYIYGRFPNPYANSKEMQHLTALQAERFLPKFKEMYSFAFVRNPWDRIVSEFIWRERERERTLYHDQVDSKRRIRKAVGRKAISKILYKLLSPEAKFRKFIESIGSCSASNVHLLPQHKFVLDADGNRMVKDILRFENFSEDYKRLINKLNLPLNILHLNQSIRYGYKHYFDDEPDLQDCIARIYEKDIEIFGYKYD